MLFYNHWFEETVLSARRFFLEDSASSLTFWARSLRRARMFFAKWVDSATSCDDFTWTSKTSIWDLHHVFCTVRSTMAIENAKENKGGSLSQPHFHSTSKSWIHFFHTHATSYKKARHRRPLLLLAWIFYLFILAKYAKNPKRHAHWWATWAYPRGNPRKSPCLAQSSKFADLPPTILRNVQRMDLGVWVCCFSRLLNWQSNGDFSIVGLFLDFS